MGGNKLVPDRKLTFWSNIKTPIKGVMKEEKIMSYNEDNNVFESTNHATLTMETSG
jgi:hypothetical protein